MMTVIKKGSSKDKIRTQMDAVLSKNLSHNLMNYAGTLKTDIDPSAYQKKMRDEWEG
jgi:hypothetical protein